MTKKNFHSARSEKKALAYGTAQGIGSLDRSRARCILGVPAISNCALTVGRTLTQAKDVHAALPTNEKSRPPGRPQTLRSLYTRREGRAMNDENLITFNQMRPERHKELSRLGGIASGQTRARRAYMKAAAREMQLRMVYFKDADADLKAEWTEFQRWRRSEKKRRVNAGKRGRKA